MRSALIIFNAVFILFLIPSLSLCADSIDLEKVIVKPSNYSSQILSASDIKENNLNSLTDLLDYISGMDLRYRSPQGIQGDLSLRGSTYEQVAVLIDGINLMDPQTGHHNLDIPLTVFDVERVEVVKEGDSSLYGAGAFAGSINIITKKPKKRAFNLDTLFGEHALFGQALSLSLPQENFSSRASFEHKVSKAARPNTDFEYKTASLYLNKDLDTGNIDTLFGYQKKDFGADSFYSNLFPEEEEHTETFFYKTGLETKLDFGTLKGNLFLRKHRDKFILRRNNPTSVNYHTTYVYGLNSGLDLPTRYGGLFLGIDIGQDEINSTNLGKHSRLFEAGSFGFIPDLPDKFNADLRVRLDHYQKWGLQESYNFYLRYAIRQNLKIKGSFAHAFRIPSFTELYYSDAANKGNPELKAEKSDSFRLGFNFTPGPLDLGLEGFFRRGKNLIDWTRTATTDPWQATDLGSVDFKGIEFISEVKAGLKLKGLSLEKVKFSYNYTDADKSTSGFFSKYALDILKHQYLLDIYSSLFGINLNWQFSYNQRYYGETYFVGNVYIGKKLKYKDATFEPFVKIDNFSDTEYSEIAGVLQPGRWVKTGLKFEW